MVSEPVSRVWMRAAKETDVPALTAIKGEGSEALQRDRLRDAQDSHLRYYVLLADQEILGFACLVFRRPAHWSDAGDTRHLPQIVDLQVKESQRGKGYGSEFMRLIETEAAGEGYGQIYLTVEPMDNPRAFQLYQRLGYQSLQSEPHRTTWEFRDSAGVLHGGELWVVDMVKRQV